MLLAPQVWLVPLASWEQEEEWAPRALLAPLDPEVSVVTQVSLALRETLVARESLVILAPQAPLVLPVRRGREGPTESLAYLDLLGPAEREEAPEFVVSVVWREELAQWECPVAEVLLAPLVPVDSLVMQVALAKLA